MNIKISLENYMFFNALASKTRLKIIEILLKKSSNYSEIAALLNISIVMVSKHINILEKANIVEVMESNGKKGKQKSCRLIVTNYQLMHNNSEDNNITHLEIPVGHFINYKIPRGKTCGIATTKELLGRCDDPRYFSHPERYNAKIIWMEEGEISYCLPGYLIDKEKISSLEFSLELCSEAPGVKEDYPSDIYFYLNDALMAMWTSPGDFGNKKGIYTPKWWYLSEYGLLVTIKINKIGTFLNGVLFSSQTINQYFLFDEIDNIFKISAPKNTPNSGGLNLFGREYGNYNHDILVTLKHKIDEN